MLRHKWIWIVIGTLVLLFFIGALAPSSGTTQTSPSNSSERSPGYNLAMIESNSSNPPAKLVSIFEKMTARLHTLCPNESETLIGDYLVKSKQVLGEKGIDETLLDFGLGLATSFPDGIIAGSTGTCADHAAILTALIVANSTD